MYVIGKYSSGNLCPLIKTFPFNHNRFSRKTNHSFDIVTIGGRGSMEYHYVAALRIAFSITNFIRQNIFLIMKV